MSGLKFLNSLKGWSGHGTFGLETMTALMRSLGDPQNQIKTVHVAGTNGKGSVCTMIAGILGAAGFRVGLTTSPHLGSQNERIVIDGWPISDIELERLATKIYAASNREGLEPSFFEAISACAFLAFAEANVNYAVIEVGLGGRLDATNVISRPEATVVVTIDYDHQHILGSELERIAFEKAGIIKPGVPVFVGELTAPVLATIAEIARDKSAALFEASKLANNWSPALKGSHQIANAKLACAVGEYLGVSESDCIDGIATVTWPGRLERCVVSKTEFILDGAHNPAGAKALHDYLEESLGEAGSFSVAFGVLTTKNWKKLIENISFFDKTWFVLEPDSDSAVPAQEISEYLSSIGVRNRSFDRDYGAFLRAVVPSEQRVVVCGSLYLIGRLRQLLGLGFGPLWQRQQRQIGQKAING